MMACCTTIVPPQLNSTNSPQKRSASGIFDLPKTAKRQRRPFSTTNLTTLSAVDSAATVFTPETTINSSNSNISRPFSLSANRPIILDSSSSQQHTSVFNTTIPYSPLTSVYNCSPVSSLLVSNLNINETSIGCSTSSSSNDNNHQQQQQQQQHSTFKNELMERIQIEARRLNKRRSLATLSSSTIMTTSSVNTDSTTTNTNNNTYNASQKVEDNTSKTISILTNTSMNIKSSEEHQNATNSKVKLLLNEMNKKKQLNLTSPAATSAAAAKPTIAISNHTQQLINKTNDNNLAAATVVVPKNNKSDAIITAANTLKSANDVPIFSMNQVNTICERMLKERELCVREEYDKILAQKLSEQYDSFVRFTHEQIQRRFENSQCSYVS